jgi:hypothetical protein
MRYVRESAVVVSDVVETEALCVDGKMELDNFVE